MWTIGLNIFYKAKYGPSVFVVKTDKPEPFTAIIKGFVERMIFLHIFAHLLKGGS